MASFEVSQYGAAARTKGVAQIGDRSCTLSCSRFLFPETPEVPAFRAVFEDNGKRIAWGQTLSTEEMVAATREWLLGASLDAI